MPASGSGSPHSAGLGYRGGRTMDHPGTFPGGTREPDKVFPLQSGHVYGLCMYVCLHVHAWACVHAICASLNVRACMCMYHFWDSVGGFRFFFDPSLSTAQVTPVSLSLLCDVPTLAKDQ